MQFKRSYLKNGLILLHILFAVIGLLIYRFNYQTSEDLLVRKSLNKQTIVAKAGSLAIENLLNNIQNQLSSFIFSFTKIDENSSFDKNATRSQFVSYIERTSLPISGIALYDDLGKLIIIENREHLYVGENEDFSSYDYIQWSKNPNNRNKVFISKPYTGQAGSAVGKIIMVLAEPIYFGNRFKGTLTIRVLVDDFRKAFIDPLISEKDENSFILDTNGSTIVKGDVTFNKALYNEFISQVSKTIKNNNPNNLAFQNPTISSQTLLAGISKIDVPNTDRDLYMVVVTSKDEITSSLSWLRTYGFVWLGFGVLTTTIVGFSIMFLKDPKDSV